MFTYTITLLALHSGVVPHVHPHEAPAAVALVLALIAAGTFALRKRSARR